MELPDTTLVPPREPVQRWRLVLGREPIAADLGQRDVVAAWEAALSASGLPLAGLDAERPRPKLALAAPLGAGIRGEAELLDIWLVERLPAWAVREALADGLPPGWSLRDLYDVWPGEAALPGQVAASVYRAILTPGAAAPDRLATAAAALLAERALPRERHKGERTVGYDLRPFVDGLEVAGANGEVVVRMTLRHDPERGVGRPDEALSALGERAGLDLTGAVMVREQLVLAEPAPRPPAAPRRRPGGSRGQRPSG